MSRRSVVGVVAVLLSATPPRAAADRFAAIVAGFDSDNVVKIDLATGESEVLIPLAPGSRPRSIAVDANGLIYVGLRGLPRNVQVYDPRARTVQDFTASLPEFGVGMIAFDGNGDLIAAHNTSGGSSVSRYDGDTGNLIASFSVPGFSNEVGLIVEGQFAYSVSWLQDRIARYDLSSQPVQGQVFIDASGLIDHAIGMTIGHNGNLFVSSTLNTRIQQFDLTTEAFVGTFVDLAAQGFVGGVVDLHYEPRIGHYFITGDTKVHELDNAGNLVQSYHSDLLAVAHGIAIIPIRDPGDLNCDGAINAEDIDPFFLAEGTPSLYVQLYPDCDPFLADINEDGWIDSEDIDPFFVCLGLGGCP